MTQENEVTPSTTNTAAREVVQALRDLLRHVEVNTCTHEETHRGGAIWTICDSCDRKWADDRGGFVPHEDAPEVVAARAALESFTLTQQQGGEQEAGWQNIETAEAEFLNNLAEKGGLADPLPGMLRHCARLIAGKRPAVVAPDRYETEEEGDAYAHGYVDGEDAAIAALRTQPPAASEGGAVHIMRAAFVTADENYSGKRVAAVYADASMIGQRVHVIPAVSIDNTSKQAAGEAVDFTDTPIWQPHDLRDGLQRKCSAWGVYWRAPDAHGVIVTVDQATELLADAVGVEVEITTPPRHPADEALIAAYDAGFAASDEGWNAEIWPDVESRPDYYVKDRAEAIAALQAGTP